MSDYMFKLESHLSTDQFRVVGQVQEVAAAAGVNLFLTGGAMRDMLGGFPVRDLDFTVEGNALSLSKDLAKKYGARWCPQTSCARAWRCVFPGGGPAELGMAHTEKFAKSGARPQVSAATIHEDLRCRDFTVNAIALSLNKASMGLPIDPTNGVGDIERKELRTIHNYSFYDDPIRMLRLIRFKVRLGYTIDERTRLQYENARGRRDADAHHAAGAGRGIASHGGGAIVRRPDAGARRGKAHRVVFAGADRLQAESGDVRQAAEGSPNGAVWRRMKMHSLPLVSERAYWRI